MDKKTKRETFLLAICAFLSLALFYLIMLNLWGLSLFGSAIDYTRFGTWSNAISGIGTTSALIVALASLYSQRSMYQAAEARRLLEEETSVFLWLNYQDMRDEKNKHVGWIWDLKIHNSTRAPIYHWKVNFYSHSNHLCNSLKRPLLPGENVFNLLFLDNLEPSKTPESTLIFEGRSDRIWTRSTSGNVVQVSTNELICAHTSSDSIQQSAKLANG
jgi:hypothetical protein